MRRHTASVAALAALLSLFAPAAEAERAADAEKVDAAKAIFGDGLLVKRSGDTITVDWNPAGLTAKKARRYLETYWGPALDDIDPYTVFSVNEKRWVFPFYTRSLREHTRAYFLMEPDGRREICRRIAGAISDPALRKKTLEHCTVRAVETANKPVLGFRGKKVSYKTELLWAGIWFKERLWQNADGVRQMLLVAPGPGDVDHYDQLKYVADVADIGRTARDQFSVASLRRLRRLRDRAADMLKKADELIAARDAELTGGDPRVVFTDYPVSGWRSIRPVKTDRPVSCYATHVHTYAPALPDREQLYTMTVKLNGRACEQKDAGFQGRPVRKHSPLWSYCTGRDKYDSGDNTVQVTLTAKKSGEVVAKNSLTCRTR